MATEKTEARQSFPCAALCGDHATPVEAKFCDELQAARAEARRGHEAAELLLKSSYEHGKSVVAAEAESARLREQVRALENDAAKNAITAKRSGEHLRRTLKDAETAESERDAALARVKALEADKAEAIRERDEEEARAKALEGERDARVPLNALARAESDRDEARAERDAEEKRADAAEARERGLRTECEKINVAVNHDGTHCFLCATTLPGNFERARHVHGLGCALAASTPPPSPGDEKSRSRETEAVPLSPSNTPNTSVAADAAPALSTPLPEGTRPTPEEIACVLAFFVGNYEGDVEAWRNEADKQSTRDGSEIIGLRLDLQAAQATLATKDAEMQRECSYREERLDRAQAESASLRGALERKDAHARATLRHFGEHQGFCAVAPNGTKIHDGCTCGLSPAILGQPFEPSPNLKTCLELSAREREFAALAASTPPPEGTRPTIVVNADADLRRIDNERAIELMRVRAESASLRGALERVKAQFDGRPVTARSVLIVGIIDAALSPKPAETPREKIARLAKAYAEKCPVPPGVYVVEVSAMDGVRWAKARPAESAQPGPRKEEKGVEFWRTLYEQQRTETEKAWAAAHGRAVVRESVRDAALEEAAQGCLNYARGVRDSVEGSPVRRAGLVSAAEDLARLIRALKSQPSPAQPATPETHFMEFNPATRKMEIKPKAPAAQPASAPTHAPGCDLARLGGGGCTCADLCSRCGQYQDPHQFPHLNCAPAQPKPEERRVCKVCDRDPETHRAAQLNGTIWHEFWDGPPTTSAPPSPEPECLCDWPRVGVPEPVCPRHPAQPSPEKREPDALTMCRCGHLYSQHDEDGACFNTDRSRCTCAAFRPIAPTPSQSPGSES
jgi:hypothetical protein